MSAFDPKRTRGTVASPAHRPISRKRPTYHCGKLSGILRVFTLIFARAEVGCVMRQFQVSARNSNDEVILFVVSSGLNEFIENTITSIRRCGVDTTICIALPTAAVQEIMAVTSQFENIEYLLLENISSRDYSMMTKYFDYQKLEFCEFVASKWIAIRFLLEEGFSRVIYTDVDVVWLRNPLPLLREALDRFEVAMQTEGVEIFPPEFCCGFMSFRNSQFVIDLLKQLENLHAAGTTKHDQRLFNGLVSKSVDVLNRIHGLSELLFANGQNMKRSWLNRDILVGWVGPMIFHANWTIGTKNKRLMLERRGYWLVDRRPKLSKLACRLTRESISLSKWIGRKLNKEVRMVR